MDQGTSIWRRIRDHVSSIVPERTKRLILLTSLTAGVKKTPDLDPGTLRKLNELLDLCKNENAMKFPAHLSHVIWDGTVIDAVQPELEGQQEIAEGRLAELISRVTTRIPTWLRYNETTMASDLRRLFQYHSRIFG